MADEDKEKAEKLAAAKKRYEQLKKEPAKKAKKSSGKKKEDKAGAASDAKTEDNAVNDEANAESTPAVEDEKAEAEEEGKADDTVERPDSHGRRFSVSEKSRQRSESFRQGTGPASPSIEVQELYRKQAGRIEELEKDNKALKEQQEESVARLGRAEEELESLREGGGDLAELKSKSKEADRLQDELASTQRKLTQAQHANKSSNRRSTGSGPELEEQLASKTSAIESLQLEISNLRNQVSGLQTTVSERDASATELEERAQAADSATDAVKRELDALKVSIAFPSDATKAASEDPEALTKRITVLESDLRSANTSVDAAAKRATSLEQKIEALTKLHRDATSVSQAKERELGELRAQLRKHDRASHVRDASDFELGDEGTETGALQARIRALEAENFDLKRGVWRERRAEMQPGMDDDAALHGHAHTQDYEDVDLNGPYSPLNRLRGASAAAAKHSSSLQDVIASGISAFTGQLRHEAGAGVAGAIQTHGHKQSLGLLDDEDDDFDPEAFRVAQEEEAKRRIERMKEVKRGLEKWKGWRMDVAEMRAASAGEGGLRDVGPVFEI